MVPPTEGPRRTTWMGGSDLDDPLAPAGGVPAQEGTTMATYTVQAWAKWGDGGPVYQCPSMKAAMKAAVVEARMLGARRVFPNCGELARWRVPNSDGGVVVSFDY